MSDGFVPAQRKSAKPLIGLYSESGGGKTYSALTLARGFVGKTGKIGMIETESGRGEAYASPTEYPEFAGSGASNYFVRPIRENFGPSVYYDALKDAENANLDALIIDSASHEWEGPGGVLDMAATNQAGGMRGVLVWQQPKIQHARKFMIPLLQTPIQLVTLCMRARYPMEQKIVDGKKDWVRSGTLEPKQSDDILYEMFLHGWLSLDHKFHIGNCANRSLRQIFEKEEVITLAHGEALAAWARGTDAPRPKTSQEILQEVKDELLEAAEGGMAPLSGLWGRLEERQRKYLAAYYSEILTPVAQKADAGQDPNA